MNQADLCCGKYWAGYFGVLIPTLSPKPCTWTDLGVSPKSYAKVSSFLFYFILFYFSLALAQILNPGLAKLGLYHAILSKCNCISYLRLPFLKTDSIEIHYNNWNKEHKMMTKDSKVST